MSESIDRRVVEMRFDNKQFEQNVNTTMTVLDKLKEKLSFKGAGKDFEATSGLSSAIDGVKSRFSALEVVGMTALVNLTNSAVNFGKQLAKSLTIDQVHAGFSEYELKMGSMQTIMASTGADIQTVNKYLNDLNTYSDKTIYSFSDMTSSIGKFTNAGVDLDTAVRAIQGISNEAAVSGANAQEASRAMYNFAQALSAGYVKLIDWKSIENANMATKEFKQQLIDTAVAEGTLEKSADGTYKVLTQGAAGGFKDSITATKNFNDSLSAAWMTTDVLTKTLGKYADETTDIGKKSFAAAQDVKTFSQLMDTVKEAIGSGWAQTFENIFGNLEEAKQLWTGVNNVISDFVGKSADARNALLKAWHDSPRGRDAMITGFQNLYKAVSAIVKPIHEAFRDIFPPTTVNQLLNFSTRFRALTSHMIISAETAEKIKNVFTVVFSVLKTGITIVTSIAKIFASLVKTLLPLGGSGLSVLDNISQSFMTMADAADTVTGKLKSLAGGVLNKAMSGLGKAFAFIGEGLSKLNLAKVGGLLAGGGIFAAFMKLGKVFDTFKEKIEGLFGGGSVKEGLMDKLGGSLDKLSESLNSFQASLKIGQLVAVAIALGVLAAACSTLANIPAKSLAKAAGAIGTLFIELGVASHFIDGANAKGLISMSFAIILLARAVKTLSEVEGMGKGLLGVGVLLGELTAFCVVFDRMKLKPQSLTKTGAGLIAMAIAINLLAKPVKELGSLDASQLVKGLLAMTVMLGEFALVAKAFSKIDTGGIIKSGAAMVLMAASMRMLVGPLQQLGSMNLGSLAKGLGGMAVALLELAGFTKIMSLIASSTGNIMKASAALLVMSVGIKIMASAINQMGMNSGAGKGLSIMFGSLVILAGAMALMQKSLAGAAAMIIVAGALAIMAPPLALLSSLNIIGVVTGLAALAGTLAIFGVGAMLLTPVIPLMIALSAAMALLGVGVLSLGAGMTMLVAAFAMATGPIIQGAQMIAQAFPIIAQGIGDGIIKIIEIIGTSAETIKNTFVQIVEAVLTALYESGPRIIEVGLYLILQLLTGINNNIFQITYISLQIITNFINGITAGLPMVVEAGVQFIIAFLNSMATAISEHGAEVAAALENVILSALEVLAGLIPFFGDSAANAIKEYRSSLRNKGSGISGEATRISTSTGKSLTIKGVGKNTSKSMNEMNAALRSGGKTAKSTAQSLASETAEKFDVSDETGTAGDNTAQGFIDALYARVNDSYQAGYANGSAAARGYEDGSDTHSPSRKTYKTGMYTVLGFINGMRDYSDGAYKSASKIATITVDAYNSSLGDIDGQVTSRLSFMPTIDTSKISDQVRSIDASFSREDDRFAAMMDILSEKISNLESTLRETRPDYDQISEAVRFGASNATLPSITLNGRELKRGLKDMGVITR